MAYCPFSSLSDGDIKCYNACGLWDPTADRCCLRSLALDIRDIGSELADIRSELADISSAIMASGAMR